MYDTRARGSGTSAARAAGTAFAVSCFAMVVAGAPPGLHVMLAE
ncbi:hypothetical protein [Microbispora siamensis]|nr:hypothetical protein [Microbispora siamensis]